MINLTVTGEIRDLEFDLGDGMVDMGSASKTRDCQFSNCAFKLGGDVDGLYMLGFSHTTATEAVLINNQAEIGKLWIDAGGAGLGIKITASRVAASLIQVQVNENEDGVEFSNADECTIGTLRIRQLGGT